MEELPVTCCPFTPRPMSSRPGHGRFDLEPPLRRDHHHPLGPERPLSGGRPQPQCCSDGAGDRVDLISNLPDDLLREVLARLRCVRAAAQTSALSCRWRDLWRQLRRLSFHRVKPKDLLDVLAQVPSSDLDLLHIEALGHCCTDECFPSLLRTAASFAPVEFFFSAAVIGSSVEVPIFRRAESISLELKSISSHYQLDTTGDFPMLKRLSLSASACGFNYTDLISRCPHLHALRVCISDNPDKIRVYSATIRELIVDSNEYCIGIDIEAPLLERLSVSGCFFTIFMDSFLSQFPCLRSLQFHCWIYPAEELRVRSTTIQEIVLDGVDIVGSIDVDAPALKIFTLRHARLNKSIHTLAPELKVFTLHVKMDSHVKMLLSAPTVENLSWSCWFFKTAVTIH